MIFVHLIINILHHRACYLVTLVPSCRIFCKFEFRNILESYHKIVGTATIHSLHHVKAVAFTWCEEWVIAVQTIL